MLVCSQGRCANAAAFFLPLTLTDQHLRASCNHCHMQQAEVLVAAGLRVVVYTGEDNRDARNRAGWQRLHQEADVLCATPDALNRLIAHAFITVR